MDVTTRCGACSTELSRDAAGCPHCRPGAGPLHRGEGRSVLGVCSLLARGMGVSVTWVRLAFVVMLFSSAGLGFLLYLLVWAFTPARAGTKAPLQGLLDWVSRVANTPVDDDAPRWERRV
ncbi:MAG: PspC domain-containing protein [Myxococcaceae bacterium]|nr:MAG: PspC domain-containing protein [Myxococcaceae bacterium]